MDLRQRMYTFPSSGMMSPSTSRRMPRDMSAPRQSRCPSSSANLAEAGETSRQAVGLSQSAPSQGKNTAVRRSAPA